MKKIKKMLSLLLVGVIAVTSLFCGTATASAAHVPYYVNMTAGDKSGQYYIDLTPVTDLEYKYLTQTATHGYSVQIIFNRGAKNQVALQFADMYTEDGTHIEMPINSYKNQFFDVKKSGFIQKKITLYGSTVTSYSFQFELDASNKFVKEVIEEINKCDKCNVTIKPADPAQGENFLGLKDYQSVDFASYIVDTYTPLKKISDLKVSSVSSKTYTGGWIEPDVTVKDGNKKLVKGTDYALSYSNNRDIGTATISVIGQGDYYGLKEVTFKIIPAKTTLTAKKSGNGYTLSWKKVSGIDKYQIQYSTDGGKTYKSGGTATSGKTSKILKLGSGKSYTFRIRSYKIVDGKKYYSNWSKAVKVK